MNKPYTSTARRAGSERLPIRRLETRTNTRCAHNEECVGKILACVGGVARIGKILACVGGILPLARVVIAAHIDAQRAILAALNVKAAEEAKMDAAIARLEGGE